MLKRVSIILWLILSLAVAVTAAGAKIDIGGITIEESQIDAIFASFNRTDSPGCAAALVKAGEVVFSKGYGLASLELGVPIRPDTVFYAGSVSKQFVAFSVALLAEAGKLSLDDDVRRYLPELRDYGTPITIRHLIHHTSGLRDYLELWRIKGRDYLDSMPVAEVLDLVSRQEELNFPPGERHLYSNSGYFLLAVIVERVSGESLRDFARDEIFAPLGMRSSHFHDDSSHSIARKAEGYFSRDDGSWGVLAQRFALVGSGGLYTSVEDLARWDGNFYANRLGKGQAELIQATLQTGRLNDGENLEYAFGLSVGKMRGLTTVRHGGALGGYRAHLLRFPDQRFSVALLCNLANANPGELADRLAELVLAHQLEAADASRKPAGSEASRIAITLEPSRLERFTGSYANDEGHILAARMEGEKLILDWPGLPPLELLPESETVFFQTFNADRFEFRGDRPQGADRLVLLRADEETAYLRTPTVPREQLLLYAGEFYSRELDSTLTFFQKEGRLWMRAGYNDPVALSAVREHSFSNGRGTLVEFQAESTGPPHGLRLHSGRVRNLSFVRK